MHVAFLASLDADGRNIFDDGGPRGTDAAAPRRRRLPCRDAGLDADLRAARQQLRPLVPGRPRAHRHLAGPTRTGPPRSASRRQSGRAADRAPRGGRRREPLPAARRHPRRRAHRDRGRGRRRPTRSPATPTRSTCRSCPRPGKRRSPPSRQRAGRADPAARTGPELPDDQAAGAAILRRASPRPSAWTSISTRSEARSYGSRPTNPPCAWGSMQDRHPADRPRRGRESARPAATTPTCSSGCSRATASLLDLVGAWTWTFPTGPHDGRRLADHRLAPRRLRGSALHHAARGVHPRGLCREASRWSASASATRSSPRRSAAGSRSSAAAGPSARTDYDFGGETLPLNAWHQDQVTTPPEGATASSPRASSARMPRWSTASAPPDVQAHPEFDRRHRRGLIRPSRHAAWCPTTCSTPPPPALGTPVASRGGRRPDRATSSTKGEPSHG